MKQYVLRAIGKDRVGIVDDISALTEANTCNIEESRMAVLGGEFAVIMLVTGPEEGLNNLIQEAERSVKDVHIECFPTVQQEKQEDRMLYVIESVSFDAPGIVHSLTRLLRSRQINIEDLETETAAAPWTGAPMFHMRVRVGIRRGENITELKEALEDLAGEESLDIRIKPLGIEESIL